jgi:transposase
LLPRRWVGERNFGWLSRFRWLSRNFKRLPQVLTSLHFVVFAILMLLKAMALLASGAISQHALGF